MTLDYGNYGIFLILGNAGFISTTVVSSSILRPPHLQRIFRLALFLACMKGLKGQVRRSPFEKD